MNRSRALQAAMLACASLTTNLACADAGPLPKKEKTMESAKRRAPSARPIEHQGVRYEQMRRPKEHGFKQSGGVIAAIDEASARQLWAVQLYETTFDPAEELDAQEVYVSQLSIDAKAGVLKAIDERKRVWLIKLSDHSVTQAATTGH
jgi:hypothetical protein